MAITLKIRVKRTTAIGSLVVDSCQGIIEDGETHASPGGIIMPTGVLPIPVAGAAGTETTWLAFDDAHPVIGGYRKLKNSLPRFFIQPELSVVMPDVGPYPEEVLIDEFATLAGDMDGVNSNASTTEFQILAKRQLSGSEITKVRMDVYHRTTGGSETLLGSLLTPNLTTSQTQYLGDLVITESWATNELLVFKCLGLNWGTPP